jgi:SAM-dependent methyltransferase
MPFKDHFSACADGYQSFRPSYPTQLFSYLVSLCKATDLVWDCATGSGQAAFELAEYFDTVVATDASAEQISRARASDSNSERNRRIDFRVATAEHSGLASHSVDLITVAQALHWFDLDAFESEVNRIAKPGGVLAVWTYNLITVSERIDPLISTLYHETLGPYWPAERELVERGYAGLTLPFDELASKQLKMEMSWNLDDLLGYLNTWSATRLYTTEQGQNPVDKLRESLQPVWGEPIRQRTVAWPITLSVWRISG